MVITHNEYRNKKETLFTGIKGRIKWIMDGSSHEEKEDREVRLAQLEKSIGVCHMPQIGFFFYVLRDIML